jgi:hypothetical protein
LKRLFAARFLLAAASCAPGDFTCCSYSWSERCLHLLRSNPVLTTCLIWQPIQGPRWGACFSRICTLLAQGGGVAVSGGTITFQSCGIHNNQVGSVRPSLCSNPPAHTCLIWKPSQRPRWGARFFTRDVPCLRSSLSFDASVDLGNIVPIVILVRLCVSLFTPKLLSRTHLPLASFGNPSIAPDGVLAFYTI